MLTTFALGVGVPLVIIVLALASDETIQRSRKLRREKFDREMRDDFLSRLGILPEPGESEFNAHVSRA